MMRIALFLAFLVALSVAQAPVPPVWYQAASASVEVEGWSERREDRHFFRWFYDEAAKKQRLDGPQRYEGEFYWTETVLDVNLNQQWFVVFQRNLVLCFTGPTNRTLPNPNFAMVRYAGKAEIGHVVVNQWIERRENRDFSSIFSRADNGQIRRIDIHHPMRTAVFEFREFDAGPQNPSLWQIPTEILNICNPVANMDEFMRHM